MDKEHSKPIVSSCLPLHVTSFSTTKQFLKEKYLVIICQAVKKVMVDLRKMAALQPFCFSDQAEKHQQRDFGILLSMCIKCGYDRSSR